MQLNCKKQHIPEYDFRLILSPSAKLTFRTGLFSSNFPMLYNLVHVL